MFFGPMNDQVNNLEVPSSLAEYMDISDVFIQFVVFTFYPKHMGFFYLVYFSNNLDYFFCRFFVSRKKISSVFRVLEYMLIKEY